MNKNKDDNFMKEIMDMRRFFLCLLRKWWLIILALVLGAILGVGIYKIYYAITDSKPKYQVTNDYYVAFNVKDYPNGMDYYNAYTWGLFVVDDKIVDDAFSCIDSSANVTKQDIKDSVSTKMVSDYRIISVSVTNTDETKVNVISEAYKEAMPKFADYVNELYSIELWSCGDKIIANVHDKALNAAILGSIITAIIFAFAWAIFYCIDDRIYVENDLNRSINIPFLGYDCEGFAEDTKLNTDAIVKDAKTVTCETVNDIPKDSEIDGVIIAIPMGKRSATKVSYDLGMFAKQNIKVYGAVLTECDKTYLKCYYGRK